MTDPRIPQEAEALADLRAQATKIRPRWCIRVTYRNGCEAYLRHGARVGYGAIVQFRSKRDADVNVGFISEGLDRGDVVTVVRYRKDFEEPNDGE